MVIDAGGADIGVAQPLLHFYNIRPLVEGIGRGRGTRCVWAEAVDGDSDLFAVAFDHAVDAGRLQGSFHVGAGGVGSYGFEEWGVAVGAVAGGVQVFGDRAKCSGVNRNVPQLFALAVNPKMLDAAALVKVLHLEAAEFLAAQRVVEEGAQDCSVALSFEAVALRGGQQGAHLGI